MIPPIRWHASATQATLMEKNGLNSVKREPAAAAAFILVQPLVFSSDPVRDSFVVPRLPGHPINIADVSLCIIKPKPRPKRLQSRVCFGWGRHKSGGLLAIIAKSKGLKQKYTSHFNVYMDLGVLVCIHVYANGSSGKVWEKTSMSRWCQELWEKLRLQNFSVTWAITKTGMSYTVTLYCF